MLSALAKHLCSGEGDMVQRDRPISQDAVYGESISSVFPDICNRESLTKFRRISTDAMRIVPPLTPVYTKGDKGG